MNSQCITPSQTSKSSLLRERIKIDDSKVDNLIFKIADTRSELEQAFRLVHNAYIKEGYINPHPSGMRVHPIQALPTSTTFVGVRDDKVVTTLSLFPDSELGLPMDSIYKEELDTLRLQRRKLAEVGALASDTDFRCKNFNIPLHLNKIMYLYAKNYLQIDDLVITVNPKHQSFYRDILLFENFGETKAYQSVNENPAMLFRCDLHIAEEEFYKIYHHNFLDKNLYHFFCIRQSECISLPSIKQSVNVWTEELIKYFFHEGTNLFSSISQDILDIIKLHHIYDRSERLQRLFVKS